ncbi:MAG: bleomycin resistance family protein [Blastochloris sp.]|nr:bleomycin resistance family protein [Blastochloris sp.]
MFEQLIPNLMVKDITETVIFYQDVLGFDFVMAVSPDYQTTFDTLPRDNPFIYALVRRDGIEIQFQSTESLAEDVSVFEGMHVGASVAFYYKVNNIEVLYSELKSRAEVVKDFATTWYDMREFYIRDCNGYVLGFAQSVGN